VRPLAAPGAASLGPPEAPEAMVEGGGYFRQMGFRRPCTLKILPECRTSHFWRLGDCGEAGVVATRSAGPDQALARATPIRARSVPNLCIRLVDLTDCPHHTFVCLIRSG